MGFIGMTEVMPCYKAFEIVARMSFSAACFAAEGICCEWLTKPERLYRLRKRPSRDEIGGPNVCRGSSPTLIQLALSARLKPCPGYKAFEFVALMSFSSACSAQKPNRIERRILAPFDSAQGRLCSRALTRSASSEGSFGKMQRPRSLIGAKPSASPDLHPSSRGSSIGRPL